MKKVLTLLAAVVFLSAINAQVTHQKDPYTKTFIQNTKRLPNQQIQSEMRKSEAWKSFKQSHGDWWVEFNEQTGTPHRAFGTPIAASGATPELQALNFLTNELKGFNVKSSDLSLLANNTTEKYHYVTYIQQYNGLDILWSEATVRLSLSGKVIMFGLDIYNGITVSTIPGISTEGIKSYASSDFTIEVNEITVNPDLKILPVSGEAGLEYKLVYEVTVNTMNTNNIPGKYYSLVDANTGKVYYRQNEVKECGAFIMTADVQVNSDITDNPLVAPVNRGLPYLRVEIDGDEYFTDANGFLTVNTITDPTPATIDLKGRYARVSQGTGATNIESIDIILNPGMNLIEFDEESGAMPSEVSAYYWQNIVHDHMKFYFPTFTDLDVDQLIRVERNDGSCNAFYDGSSTNFYEDGGGCPSTGLFNDVVMHEYGHGINADLYLDLGDPGGMGNGAMNEGYADLWGMTVTDNPILGQGFLGGAGTNVRRYDLEPKVYPEDLVGEVHADGEIIAGAWWDVNENFGGDLTTMTALWLQTFSATVDGADGNEGEIYRDVLLEALIADDDNADLGDGTPNDDIITDAFCEHGITLIGNIGLDHTEFTTPVEVAVPLVVETDLEVDYPEYIGSASLFYRTTGAGAYTETVMTEVVGTTFQGTIPAQDQGTIIEYYFKVEDTNGCGGVVLPMNADLAVEPNLPYFAIVGYELIEFEDFDNEFGSWEVDPFGTDNAETGTWDINTPIPSTDATGYMVQTETDHTAGAGNLCGFTGNAGEFDGVGTNDVDNGFTTLRSPFFDVTDYTDPVFTYYRKYSNASPTSANPGNDVWQVYITDDGSDWKRVERTHTEDNDWRRNVVRVLDYVDLTEDVAMIFIAQDSFIVDAELNGGSLVEAAVDDLFLYDWDDVVIDTTEDTTQNAIEEELIISGIFPNPANASVSIFFNDVSGDVELVLSNAIGEMILTENLNAIANTSFTINTAQLPQGIYTLSVKNEGTVQNKRIIIQH